LFILHKRAPKTTKSSDTLISLKEEESTKSTKLSSGGSQEDKFLSKKCARFPLGLNLKVPNFFNDRQELNYGQVPQDFPIELGGRNLFDSIENFDNVFIKKHKEKKEENIDKNSISCKLFAKNFGKGLFEAKVDFTPSSDFEGFHLPSYRKDTFEADLREIQLKSAMFNEVPEDMFFVLN